MYAAPIKDNIILGLDFLSYHHCVIDMRRGVIKIGNDEVKILVRPYESEDCNTKVVLSKRITVSPYSVSHCKAKLSGEIH